MAGNLYDRAKGSQNWLEKIGSHIPGFGGYMDRETRRDADRMEREFVVTKLLNQKNAVKRAVDDLMANGVYEGLAVFDKLLSKIDKVANKIKSGAQGYSGLFDTIKIGEAELDKLYQYDLGLVEAAKEVELAATQLGSDAPTAQAKARQMGDLLDKIDDYFSKRAEILARG
jgi:hypothetical protein